MTRTSCCGVVMAVVCLAMAWCCHSRMTRVHAAGIELHKTRQSAGDLEIGGDLASVPKGETRFVSWADLDALPQQTYTVSDDTNFVGTVKISGIPLEKLPALLGAKADAKMVVAICDDAYNAHYPAEYFMQHYPLLVLRVNGEPPSQWPIGSDGSAMGPYMVSHPVFTSAWQVLAHKDEAQVPWGVLRLDFRNEAEVYAPITPQGSAARDKAVQEGFAIAKQNCFRCHSTGGEGGTKSRQSWEVIARKAANDPRSFDARVHNPRSVDPASQMAASPQYDDATMAALRAYFKSFAEGGH